MSVSVIIPVLNEAEGLAALLPELLAQQDLAEVIVADGGSRDATPDIVQSAGAQYINTHIGRAVQMNTGAAQATGDTLLFLHADTRLPPNAVVLIEEVISAGAMWGRFDLRLSGRHWLFRVVERMINWRSCLSGIATGDQAIFLRRDQFEAMGGYAEIPLMEDVEISKRLRRLKWPFCIHQPLTTSSRRWEHHGIVRTIVLMWRMRLAYFLGTSPETLAEQYRRSDTAGQGS
jgi:rSAM/selenodomain-associated transferase 2